MKKFDTGIFYNDDCFNTFKDIKDKSVDMILADLPYGTTQNKWDTILPLDKLWKEYWRILKEDGAIILTAQSPFDKVLGVSQIKYLKYEWIWEKSAASGHLNAKKQPMKSHENVLVFYKNQCNYNPIMSDGKLVRMVKNQSNASTNYGKQSEKQIYESDKRYPRSVLRFDSIPNSIGKIHPTQKPVALFEYLIKTYTNENETVLDNTAGSGTTAIAAINTNRKWICIEQDKDYYEKAIKRIEEHTTVLPV